MRRVFAVLGSALFLVLAPGIVAGLVPWWISRWLVETSAVWWLPLRILGGVLVAAGTLVLLDSFARFAIKGLGTPAPVFPTRYLVVTGLYPKSDVRRRSRRHNWPGSDPCKYTRA